MEQSILTSTKKILGYEDEETSFDHDVITHINSALFNLHQLGVGPEGGLTIDDKTTEWTALIDPGPLLNVCKTFVYLKVRMLFDPPATSFLIKAMEEQISQQEWRINVEREGTDWVDPDPPVVEVEV